MFFNNKFNTFFGLNLTLVYTFPMCMTWRFHFPLRNYDFKIVHVGTLAITHHNITYKIMLLIKSGVKISLNFGHASHVTRVTSRESRFGFHQCHYIISVTYPGIDYYSKSNNLKSLACRTELKQYGYYCSRE